MRSSAPKPWLQVVACAERQEGLVRHGDLGSLGYHSRHVRRTVLSGRLHEVHPGVYVVGHRVLSRRAQFLAAVWWVSDEAALSHASAAAFYGWIQEDPDAWPPVHVSATRDRKSRPGVVVHRTRHLEPRDVVAYGLLRVTDRVRTLVDEADSRSYPELRELADQLPSLPTQRLAEAAARLPGRAGAGRVQRLILSEDAHTRSAMERRWIDYCVRHAVPHPDARNVRVRGIMVDCWYAAARLVVELDSRAHHGRKAEMAEDRRRDRALGRAGIETIRLLWEDLAPADHAAAADVRAALTRRR